MKWRISAGTTLTLVEVALVLVACAAGALVYSYFFTSESYLSSLSVALFVGAVSAALARRAWSIALSAVVGPVLVVVAGVFHGSVPAVLAGMRGSWSRLLTTAVPADPWSELLVVPALVMWAAAFSAVLLVLRTRSVPAPLAPALAAYVFAVFAVGDQAGSHPTATVVFLMAALSLIAVRAHRSAVTATGRGGRRTTKPAVALGLVVLTVAASALFGVVGGKSAPLASGEHRFDIRDVLAPPVALTDTITPLSQVRRQLNENPPRTLFTVRLEGEATGLVTHLRTATLESFNGTTWRSSGTFRTAGSRLSSEPGTATSDSVTAHVELEDLTGPYLPVFGRPTRLSTPGEPRGRFGFDSDSGTVIGTESPEQGFRYDVTGQPARRNDLTPSSEMARDVPLQTLLPKEDGSPLLPAGLPEAVRALAAQFQDPSPFLRLEALETRLRDVSYRLDRPPGHSYAAMARLLAEGDAGGGFAEQKAAVFTTIARFWGFPARIAVGYRLDTEDGSGTFGVTTAHAHAWSEVKFAGYGWIEFDPTLTSDSPHVPPVAEAPRVIPPRPAAPTAAPPVTAQADGSPVASKPTETASDLGIGWDDVLDGTTVLASAVAVLVVLAAGVVVLVKARRRVHRRRDPDPAAQVLGAWREQFDRLAERGISPPVSLTCHEMAEHVRGRIGDVAEPFETTAELATTAIYAPDHLGHTDADRAWDQVARLTAGLYPRRVSAARMLAAVDPRPLWTEWDAARRRRHAGEQLEMGRYR
ncbi:transglutaminaseTgpA domain-containing protein [Lentzea sp. HUAS TT2]|uniref:transglutaminase family protein n=1 Tax=Lentzea sp. HUAS TT2 TaxID=3447454 RepID=UPI003F722ACE